MAYAVLYHHEHHDGSGYPYGLSRDDVPVSARAVALLDAFSAMTHERAYRTPVAVEEACRELVAAAGTQFDPELTALFTEHVRRHAPLPDAAVDQVLQRVTLLPSGADSALFGALTAPEVDPLTLIGNHRAFHEHLEAALGSVAAEDVVVLIMLQLEELVRLNEEAGHLAGDPAGPATARAAERAAARAAGRAFRISSQQLAIILRRTSRSRTCCATWTSSSPPARPSRRRRPSRAPVRRRTSWSPLPAPACVPRDAECEPAAMGSAGA